MSCINDILNYSSGLDGSLGTCSHTFLQAADMPVNFTSVKAVPRITAGMCACTCISLPIPVPRSSALLMPDHQVRTVLLLGNTPYSQFYWNGKKKMCGYGVYMEYPLVAGEQKRKLVAAPNNLLTGSIGWHIILYKAFPSLGLSAIQCCTSPPHSWCHN